MNERLYRSRDDRILAGVAGGLAEQFHVDPSLIRILWAILIIPTVGLALLVYVLMAFIVPEEPAGYVRWAAWDRAGNGYRWPDGETAPTDPAAPTSAATSTTPTAMGFTDIPAPTAADPNPTGSPPPPTTPPTTEPSGSTGGLFPARDARRAARDERREWRREHRDPTSILIFGLILILVGGFFLVRAYLPNIDLGDAWPILLVIVGIVLLLGSFRRSSGTPT